jgi:FkbM family methyltransferase
MKSLHKLFVKIKRKLFYFDWQDSMLLQQVFKGDATAMQNIAYGIFLAQGMRDNNIKYVRRCPKTNRLILKTNAGTYLATDQYFWILWEVFCCNMYELDGRYTRYPFVVFDLGANRAYASLYFAQYDNCQKIIGYEPDHDTFDFAMYNLALNPHIAPKIELHGYGLGSQAGSMNFYRIAGRDGVGCVNPQLNRAIYADDKRKMQMQSVEIRKACSEIKTAWHNIQKNLQNSRGGAPDVKYIMKIDVEGAEYDIFNDLCSDGIIGCFDLIVGESHNGLLPLTQQLEQHNFELTHSPQACAENGCQMFMYERRGSWD